MRAEQLLREGDLQGALKDLQDAIRKDPSSSRYRVFLFQLLAVRGEWERALTQLDVVRDLDRQAWPMVQTYRQAIRCEALRGEVFAGRQTPLIFGEPPPWVALLLEALRLTAQAHHLQAAELRGLAFEQAPALPGAVDGQSFQWIADADTRLGPVAEAIIDGKYYWIPFQQIREIQITAPEDLRDVVWLPAQFVWHNGGETYALIPARYPGSESCEDSRLALSRKTEWRELAENVYVGLGQRILATDREEYPLFDVRRIVMETTAMRSE
ncbi:MAG: type VI secretion system accessory protein TagJ [Methylococcaceae bacterium]|nr:type VI secretion system accessory protein TagJ [Methylococcaceae bacterium]